VTRTALRIRGAAERMARLTDDLLDMVGMDSGHLSLQLERTDAREVVAEALAMFDATAAEHGIDLSIEALPDVKISCDRQRVLQVLSNLIGNALKLSTDGSSITVEGTVSGSSLLLSVSDEAGGIRPEERGHIFERFWQGSNAGRRGTGLGLYITKGLVEAQGGHIWVASTPGRGTTFHFTVPLAGSTEAWAPSP
jgi:signal transduction histidine kinase